MDITEQELGEEKLERLTKKNAGCAGTAN